MGINCKVISGLNEKTPQNLLLDSGAFYKNFEVGTDTFETAASKLLGATKGGGSFKAVPSLRQVEVDGVRGAVKGLNILDSWEVMIGAKIVEITPDNLVTTLGLASKTTGTDNEIDYEVIQGKQCIEDTDYINNITWIGTLSGSQKPVIIQIFNAMNTKGLELSFEDKGEGLLETEFVGHYDFKNIQLVPFKIFYS